MGRLLAMDRDERLINGDGQLMAMDSDGWRNGHPTEMNSTAMDGKRLLDGDSTGMDEEERHERDSNGPRAQR